MTQNKKTISVIIGLICFVLVISGIFVSLNSNIFKIPAVKLLLDINDADLDDYYDEVENYIDLIDDVNDDEREEFYEITDMELDDFAEMFISPSVNDILKLCKILDRLDNEDIYISGIDIYDFYVEDEVGLGFAVVRIIVIAYGLLVALFSLLGALLKKIVFPILATVFSLGFFFALVSITMGIIFIALSVIHAVLIAQIKSTPVVPDNTTINA